MRAFTSNRDGMESHLSRKLHNQVPKAANTLYSDQVSSAQPGIAKSVISGDSAQSSGASSTELSSSGMQLISLISLPELFFCRTDSFSSS